MRFPAVGVARDVPQVVHHEQRRGPAPHRRAAEHRREGEGRRLDVRRAGGGHQPEEHEHEQLTEPGVAVGPRPTRVEPPRGHGSRAHHRQPPVDPQHQRHAGGHGDPEGHQHRPLHRGCVGQPVADQPRGTLPRIRIVGASHAVGVVVGVVGPHLHRHRHHQRADEPPPHELTDRPVDRQRRSHHHRCHRSRECLGTRTQPPQPPSGGSSTGGIDGGWHGPPMLRRRSSSGTVGG